MSNEEKKPIDHINQCIDDMETMTKLKFTVLQRDILKIPLMILWKTAKEGK